MTSDHTEATSGVLLRSDGAVDDETLAYARTKIDALVGRPGLPAVTGEVHLARAAAPHAGHPWSAAADLRVGGRQVVATAEEATGTEVVDRLQDRLRRQADKAAARVRDDVRRTAAPPWRGGDGRPAPDTGPGGAAQGSGVT
ncbi:hypothetical protein J2X68_002621 [Streptomyces sp. 3330]|uniref:hypothetical protein n=1 Tax=Streptomyces sp. 3330 TaxID=2817755 RepID=UPI00285881E7|nr:hypothetical protein [Streptomyces sp. 3330]MDR6975933.1 hypothetical protein [Streptomyces sp. 3330]